MSTATASRKGIGGPNTPEGKRRVSLNAMKHGLSARSQQGLERVAETIGTDFETILDMMRTYYFPRDPIEDLLVTKIARCAWRLKIMQAMEDEALGRQMTLRPSKWLEHISVLERRIDIQLHRAMAALAAKRREDQQQNAQNKLPEAPFPWGDHAQRERESVQPEPPMGRVPPIPNPRSEIPNPVDPVHPVKKSPESRDIIGRPASPARVTSESKADRYPPAG